MDVWALQCFLSSTGHEKVGYQTDCKHKLQLVADTHVEYENHPCIVIVSTATLVFNLEKY